MAIGSPASTDDASRRGWAGILATVGQLDVWLHIAMVSLTAASVVRYLSGHGLNDRGPLILGAAVLLMVIYAAPLLLSGQASAKATSFWCLLLIASWLTLVALAPSFSWVAVPLAFVSLRILPFAWATASIVVMLAAVIVAWSAMQERLDPTVIVGPVAVAALAVIAYRALERESSLRRRLLDDLQDAQADLAEAQHAAGALSERSRLSRDIHDSVAQALSSINLLLQAAEHRWTNENHAARNYVRQASLTARDGLEEVRQVVHNLASTDIATDTAGNALAAALSRTCERVSLDSGIITDLQIHGDPTLLPADQATALVRSARGALANVTEHSGATRATVSLTYQPDAVLLDVRDNGRGFNPAQFVTGDSRGRGLEGIGNRARSFGGQLTIESNPGEGTAIAVRVPIGPQ